jgi:HAD superfamily hydrolase (TIGR01509 family)
MDIKVITFDLDGVYFPNGKANFIKSLENLGVSNDEAKRVFFKSSEMNQEYKVGKKTAEEFWSWAVSEWNLSIPWREVVKIMIDGYDVNSDVVEAVRKLRKLGYKTAICTSNFPARIMGLQDKYGFLNDFGIKVLSYEVGTNKPERRLYEAVVVRSGVSPEQIVLADDDAGSIAGAKSVGITTFLYEGFEAYKDQLKSVGVLI